LYRKDKVLAKVRFEVLATASIKMAVFWVVTHSSLVEYTDVSEVAAASIIVITLMMEAANTSETSVNFYQTTRRNNSEDSHLQLYRSVTYSNFFADERITTSENPVSKLTCVMTVRFTCCLCCITAVSIILKYGGRATVYS
jgi:hypothetical protein